MARAGDTIENPRSGERITFRKTAAETGGECIMATVDLAPNGCGPPEHIHPIIEESFRVISGSLSARVAGEERTYTAGQEFVVRPGTAHRWWNDTDSPVTVEARVSPPLRLDRFLENVFAMVHFGYADAQGVPPPLRLSLVLPQFWDVVYLATPPLPVQRVTMAALGVVARLLRYPEEYPYPYERLPG